MFLQGTCNEAFFWVQPPYRGTIYAKGIEKITYIYPIYVEAVLKLVMNLCVLASASNSIALSVNSVFSRRSENSDMPLTMVVYEKIYFHS